MITVPAIWRQQAKQFMREAAYQVMVMVMVMIALIADSLSHACCCPHYHGGTEAHESLMCVNGVEFGLIDSQCNFIRLGRPSQPSSLSSTP